MVSSRVWRRPLGLGLLVLAGAALAGGVWVRHRRPAPRATTPMTQAAYLWQRAWDDAVERAVAAQRGEFAEILVLGAEMRWSREGAAHTDRPAVDWRAFGDRPVGVVLRAGPLPGRRLAREPELLAQLRGEMGRLVDEAAAAGAKVAEAQLDFDAATAQLADYAGWLRALKADLAARRTPVPLTVTALPTWLSSRHFAAVAQAADGFVLQVHSLERPQDGKPAPALCEAARAKAWVEEAGRLRRPFRVAVPTCGYAAAYDAQGKFLGACAEGPAPAWPRDARIAKVAADPAALAGLVRALATDRPVDLAGILWFRLPVAGDRRNWRMPTLRRVMAGEAPQAKLVAELAQDPSSGACDVVLANAGDGPCPARLRVRVQGARVVAGDAVAGWTMARDEQGGVVFTPPENSRAHDLGPGDRWPVGWVRFDEVDAKGAADAEPMD